MEQEEIEPTDTAATTIACWRVTQQLYRESTDGGAYRIASSSIRASAIIFSSEIADSPGPLRS